MADFWESFNKTFGPAVQQSASDYTQQKRREEWRDEQRRYEEGKARETAEEKRRKAKRASEALALSGVDEDLVRAVAEEAKTSSEALAEHEYRKAQKEQQQIEQAEYSDQHLREEELATDPIAGPYAGMGMPSEDIRDVVMAQRETSTPRQRNTATDIMALVNKNLIEQRRQLERMEKQSIIDTQKKDPEKASAMAYIGGYAQPPGAGGPTAQSQQTDMSQRVNAHFANPDVIDSYDQAAVAGNPELGIEGIGQFEEWALRNLGIQIPPEVMDFADEKGRSAKWNDYKFQTSERDADNNLTGKNGVDLYKVEKLYNEARELKRKELAAIDKQKLLEQIAASGGQVDQQAMQQADARIAELQGLIQKVEATLRDIEARGVKKY